MTRRRQPHRPESRAARHSLMLRSILSMLAVAVAGYLSLGTSCDSPSVEATATVHFAAGQERSGISVWAQGQDLMLEFGAELTFLRDGVTVTVMQQDGQDPIGSAGAGTSAAPSYWTGDEPRPTTCEHDEPSDSSGTMSCRDYTLPNQPVRWELIRSATHEAQDVEVRAVVYGDCDSTLPIGIALEADELP